MMSELRWLFYIGRKLFRELPWGTLTVVLLVLISQVSMLLASLLPLKVIVLLGSSVVPKYFPAALLEFDRAQLVFGLSVAAVFFFVLHLLTEKFTAYSIGHGVKKLIEQSNRLTLFEHQEETTARGYQRFVSGLANFVFVLLAFVVLLPVYPLLFAVSLLLILIASFVFSLLKGWPFRSLSEKAGVRLVNVLTNIAFFVCFIFMVIDILYKGTTSVLLAVIALLLIRQAFKGVSGCVLDFYFLHQHRLALDTLFFRGQAPSLVEVPQGSEGVWALASIESRTRWLPVLTEKVFGKKPEYIEVSWLQSGIPEIVFFRVYLSFLGSSECCLIALYGTSRNPAARQEATILSELEWQDRAPFPKLLRVDEVEGYHCHVYDWRAYVAVEPANYLSSKVKVSSNLLKISPPAALVERYTRSRQFFWQKIDDELVRRIGFVAGDEKETKVISDFSDKLNEIKAILKELPLVVINPDVWLTTLWQTEAGAPVVSYWGRWAIEPAGANWPHQDTGLAKIDSALYDAQKKRDDLLGVDSKRLTLSALTYALDGAFHRQDYKQVLFLMQAVLECFYVIKAE